MRIKLISVLLVILLIILLCSCSYAIEVTADTSYFSSSTPMASQEKMSGNTTSEFKTEQSAIVEDDYYEFTLARLVLSTNSDSMALDAISGDSIYYEDGKWHYKSNSKSPAPTASIEIYESLQNQLSGAIDSIQRLHSAGYTTLYVFSYFDNYYLVSEFENDKYVTPCKSSPDLAGYFVQPMAISFFENYAYIYQTQYSDVRSSHGLWFL